VASDATLQETVDASVAYAQSACGNVVCFQPLSGIGVQSVWGQFEYPTLLANQNVTGIIYMIIDDAGGIIEKAFVPIFH
jgi:hypothetical protein